MSAEQSAQRQGDEGPSTDIRPIIGDDSGNRPLWLAIGAIFIVGLVLFGALESRRRAAIAPAVRPRSSDLANAQSSGPPPLYIPPEPLIASPEEQGPTRVPPAIAPPALLRPQPSPPPVLLPPARTEPFGPPMQPVLPPTVAATNNGAAIVFDATASEAAVGSPTSPGSAASLTGAIAARARAGRLANSATVVPQGTLIAAVLETALDSTQPGQARALVSRDVINLRGDRILIPRGSRLFGTYRGELAAGQKRAQVDWTRLVRPDGVTIAIDSPAADRLGRAGIGGRVNTHFLERLGGALLQSSIDIGTAVASQSISDNSLVIAIPRGVGDATSQLIGQPPKPTLRIRQGTRISVFVARDLDFTSVEPRR